MTILKADMFCWRGAAIIGAILGLNIVLALHSTEGSGETLSVIGYMAHKADNPDRLTVSARGIKTARDGEWSAVQVADILRRV